MEFQPEINTRFHELATTAEEPLKLEQFEDLDEARLFVNWCLSGAYNDRGIERWWERPRVRLDGLTPEVRWIEKPEQVIGLAGWLVNSTLEHPQS